MNSPDLVPKNRKIRIGLIGCGRISKNHINSILIHNESAELVAICDTKNENINNALNTIKDN